MLTRYFDYVLRERGGEWAGIDQPIISLALAPSVLALKYTKRTHSGHEPKISDTILTTKVSYAVV